MRRPARTVSRPPASPSQLGYRFARRTSASAGVRLTDFSFSEPDAGVVPPEDARERALG